VEEHYEAELAHSTRILDDVDLTLVRLSEGTYGTCETCGAAIIVADLAVDPTRRMCEQHLPLGRSAEPGNRQPS
jgi:RNA polymerase-binding transcription factor DksA